MMKCTTPEISWHNRDPVLSVDFQLKNGDIYRLATGGTDTHVLVWLVTFTECGTVDLECTCDLKRHNRAVNVVRFSPSGEFLASGDDEAAIWLWRQQDSPKAAPDIFADDEDEKENKENWTAVKTLRGHIEDVYDLSWSPNSNFLISGSVDNSAIIWDIAKGHNVGLLSDHKGFVQGVSWDPLDRFVATLCSDRICRIYNINTRRVVHKLHKANMVGAGDDRTDEMPSRATRLFHDDTLKSFFRRLTFTPDGELLITPAGIVEQEDGQVLHVTHVFSRQALNKPVYYLPSKDKCTLVVRCCPTLFQLRRSVRHNDLVAGNDPKWPWESVSTMIKLPYRVIFAVATQDSVLFYDTQQPMPFAKVSNIQYTRLSDLSWSCDGRILIVSSTDGYCSFVTFAENELGIPYVAEDHRATSEISSGVNSPSDNHTPPAVLSSGPEMVPDSVKSSPAAGNATEESFPGVKPSPVTPTVLQTSGRKRVSLITLFSPNMKPAADEETSTAPENAQSLPLAPDSNLECTTPMDVDKGSPAKDASSLLEQRKSGADDAEPILERVGRNENGDAKQAVERDMKICASPLPCNDLQLNTDDGLKNLGQDVMETEIRENVQTMSDSKAEETEDSKPPASPATAASASLPVAAKMMSPAARQPRRIELITLSTPPKSKNNEN